MQVGTAFPGLMCVFTRPNSVPVFPPTYLAFHIASEQYSGLVQRDQLLSPNDNLEWLLCLLIVLKSQRVKVHCLQLYSRSLHNIVFYSLPHGFEYPLFYSGQCLVPSPWGLFDCWP